MDDFLKSITSLAPAIGGIIGGPVGSAIGFGIKALAGSITGESEPEAIVAALAADPVKLQELVNRAKELETEELRVKLADVQNARCRDVAMTQAGRYNWRADVLAFLAVGGLCFCVWLVAKEADLPERSVNAIMFVAGVLASAVRDVFAFEFGSSRGSREKDALLAGKV